MRKASKTLVDEVLAEIGARVPKSRSGTSEECIKMLTKVEKALMASITAVGIIGNGGFYFWYQCMDHTGTRVAAEAFDEMGFSDAAAAMIESLKGLPKDRSIMFDYERRLKYLEANNTRLESLFNPLDRIIWSVNEVYAAAALRYIKANRSALAAASPSLAKLLKKTV